MTTTTTPLRSALAAVLAAATLTATVSAQTIDTIAGCDELPLTPQAAAACTVCAFTELYGTTAGYTPSPITTDFCGTIENDQWIGFVAGPTGSVAFEMEAFDCSDGNGLQVAIYDADNVLVGDCFNQLFPFDGPQVFTARGLTRGEVYFIRVDGFSGDICAFTIKVISGIEAGPPLPVSVIEGPAATCTDVESTYYVELDSLTAASGSSVRYEWDVYPGPLLGAVTLSDSSAQSAEGTRLSWLGVTVDGASSSLAPGACDTLGLRVRPLSECFTQDTFAYLNVSVCRGAADRDTVSRTVLVPHCRPSYRDSVTNRVYTPGTYYEPLLDANGQPDCNAVAALVVEVQGDRLDVAIEGSRYYCTADGLLSAQVTGGVAPFSYAWRRDGFLVADSTATLVNVDAPGWYSVRVTDALGCQRTSSSVRVDSIEVAEDGLLLRTTPTDCDRENGAIGINAVYPQYFDITWSTGATDTAVVGPLTAGNYQLTLVERFSGCTIDTIVRLRMADSCYASVRGRVLMDTVVDCQAGTARYPVINARVDCSNGESVFTDQNGEYVFFVDVGTYTISLGSAPSPLLTLQCAATRTVDMPTRGTRVTGQDFFYSGPLLNDISIRKWMQEPIRGRRGHTSLIVANHGPIAQNFEVILQADPQQAYITSTRPSVYDTTGNRVVYEVSGLQPGASVHLSSAWLVSQNAMLGDTIRMSAYTDSATTSIDVMPVDNVVLCQDTVLASYDPNDKAVVPSGTGPEGYIETSDSVLQYTIRFENTGSADALYVRLEDQLSDQLDLSSFQPLGASEPYRATINEDGRLFVEFEDIVLRPASVDSLNAQGFFSYSIRQLPNLQPGDRIENTAEIYFDFNDAIITNTTVNTIVSPSSTRDAAGSPGFALFPNPTSGALTLQLGVPNEVVTMRVVSVDGRLVSRPRFEQAGTRCSLDVGNGQLPRGLYVLEVELATGERLRESFVVSAE